MKRLALLALILTAAALSSTNGAAPSVSACTFTTVPLAYEGPQDRSLYFQAMNLAAFNMLAPGDAYFGLPRLEKGLRQARSSVDPVVPPILLKSIGWIESVDTQTTRANSFGAIGPALISFDCGHGIMQVTSGMTVPLGSDSHATPEQLLVATHYAYNIARGAVILATKWNAAPEGRPIVGTDTESDPGIVENWYYAVWSYNGFTGPGANRSNHPMDPVYSAWPRTPYSCGAQNDGFGHDRSKYPYQELVWGCANQPPVVGGVQLWQPFGLTYPDLNDPKWRNPLQLANFVPPSYANMDMPTPRPWHVDSTAKPSAAALSSILGSPALSIDRTSVRMIVTGANDDSDDKKVASQNVVISNTGTGVLSWGAVSSASWLQVSAEAGVAIGPDVYCSAGPSCQRNATLTLTVNPAALSSGSQVATVRITSPQTKEVRTVTVMIASTLKTGVPGVAKH